MLFIGYFEGIDSQRGIGWRCADSLSLRSFLGVSWTEATPMHASMTVIRQRLPEIVFDQVFVFALGMLEQKGVLRGKSIAVDATTLEANAAMKSVVRKDNGQDWKAGLRTLAQAEGIANPSAADLIRLDRKRTDKKLPTRTGKTLPIPTAASPKSKTAPRIWPTKPNTRWIWPAKPSWPRRSPMPTSPMCRARRRW